MSCVSPGLGELRTTASPCQPPPHPFQSDGASVSPPSLATSYRPMSPGQTSFPKSGPRGLPLLLPAPCWSPVFNSHQGKAEWLRPLLTWPSARSVDPAWLLSRALPLPLPVCSSGRPPCGHRRALSSGPCCTRCPPGDPPWTGAVQERVRVRSRVEHRIRHKGCKRSPTTCNGLRGPSTPTRPSVLITVTGKATDPIF